uniref:Uncharacterized protein n=1 Tax=Lotharella oceanica TaxID=641309 RepID=A0A7S2TND8_9EUKA|mmetsp:Transcript_22284/g.41827  ORF Transcript_22284/g.41827 Transcript_22284/m.41827 type:complete len:243 (+) Transcript_22284:142-870(+)
MEAKFAIEDALKDVIEAYEQRASGVVEQGGGCWKNCIFHTPGPKPPVHKAILLCSEPSNLESHPSHVLDECDDEGFTPMHLACKMSMEGWVKELLLAKADITKRTLPRKIGVGAYTTYEYGGNTALHLAFDAKSTGIVQALMEAKADTMVTNDAGLLPYHMALTSKSMPDKKWFGFKPSEVKQTQAPEVLRERLQVLVKRHCKTIDLLSKILKYFRIRIASKEFIDFFYQMKPMLDEAGESR